MGPVLVKVGFSGFHLVSDRWVVPSRCLCTDGLEGGQPPRAVVWASGQGSKPGLTSEPAGWGARQTEP